MQDQLTPNFTRDEFEEDGYNVRIHPKIPELCQVIRDQIGLPIYISSGVRSPETNQRVGGSPTSSHLKGLAVDISTNSVGAEISKRNRYVIVDTLIGLGVNRIGIGKTFIHFDIDPDKDKNVIWLY